MRIHEALVFVMLGFFVGVMLLLFINAITSFHLSCIVDKKGVIIGCAREYTKKDNCVYIKDGLLNDQLFCNIKVMKVDYKVN